MNVSLTPSLEQFVRDRARSGDYNNAGEVVREALRLLKRCDEARALRLERLRAAVGEGDEAPAAGDFTDADGEAELDALIAEV